jgi:hypothetical protein
MFNRPRYSTGRTLFVFLVGLAVGTFTVNAFALRAGGILVADNLSELVRDLPKGKVIAAVSLLRALVDVWVQNRVGRDEQRDNRHERNLETNKVVDRDLE